jgi:dynein heavy chain
MYQFSLEYFAKIFIKVLKNSPFTEDSELRVKNVVDELTLTVYSNISRSLFNQHKRIFAFVIAMRVQKVDTKLYNYFVKGNYSLDKKI